MIDREKSASARLPMARVWLQRGEALATAAQARRMARRELYALDDRLLNDIGLRRDQIAGFVDGMFRGNGDSLRRPVAMAARTEAVAEIGDSSDRHFKSAA